MLARFLALVAAVLFAAAQSDGPSAEEQAAAEEHERRAQQALTDSLTDAIAMLRHGSASAKEQAAHAVSKTGISGIDLPKAILAEHLASTSGSVRDDPMQELARLASPVQKLHSAAPGHSSPDREMFVLGRGATFR